MSRIGRMPIQIPDGVKVSLSENIISVSGGKGVLERKLPEGIGIDISDNKIIVNRISDERKYRALHGLTRTLISNMVTGVSTGFSKVLEITGTGYKAAVSGKKLTISVGFSKPVDIKIPEYCDVSVEGNNIILKSADIEKLGDFAAKIRNVRPAEPYKGKGIKYKGEKIKRKAGKSGKIAAKTSK